MNVNLAKMLPWAGRSGRGPVLLAITPPRKGERTLLGVENLLGSIAVPEPFSLEIAGDADGVTLMARCMDREVVRGQIEVRYPQARITEVSPEDDPLRLRDGEQAWGMTLRPAGPENAPLRTFRDDDLLDPGSDPLMAIIGALASLHPGERVVARLLMRSLGPDWAKGQAETAEAAARPSRQGSAEQAAGTGPGPAQMIVFAVGAITLLQGYAWYRAGEFGKVALLGLGVAGALIAAGWIWARIKGGGKRMVDPLAVREKTSRIAFDAEIRVVAILPEGDQRHRARDLLAKIEAAYRNYDNPAGATLRASRPRPTVPDDGMHPAGPGLFGKRSVLGVREAASLWHPPGEADDTPLVARSGAKVLLPSAASVRGGALMGHTTTGTPAEIRFPADLLHRHHLYVARTRMGKSTLMHHIVEHKMREKAAGRDSDAVVVIDPHADLVADLLGKVPESLAGDVRLFDLASADRLPGINLLDTRIFADRDRTADSVVRVARGLWEQWGPRMQSIIEHTVKSLHEANSGLPEHGQYTIIDGLRLLADERFRAEVLGRVSDPYLLQWWGRDFGKWHSQYRAEALAPVQTRLSYYATSKLARAILGQPRSTIDMRRTILDGGILLVSTAQGEAGRDVAALVGASLLNLVDAVIREQGSLPPERRRGVLVVVDEMQSMPGVDYESMLSELGKFGASFVLATQSMAKLGELSPSMGATVLANIGCLAVFQVAGADARDLVSELGRDRVAEDDITSLPVHHCYVRATVGTERMPAFSMQVRKPDPGDPQMAARIRAAAEGYTTSAAELAALEAEIDGQVSRYRESLAVIRARNAPDGPAPGRSRRRRSRSGSPDSGSEAREGEPA